MLRPAGWTGLAGGSPAPVGTGAPGSRPRFVVERRRAKRGVKSLFGLDFLGCHFRARMSGRLWEQRRIVRYYLHRWPSQRAMKRLRDRVRDRTGLNRVGLDIRVVIADLNSVLRGWGNYFCIGNAAQKFRQIDRYVVWRLFRLMVKKRGRNLRAGHADQWTEEWLNGHGLHRLRGTIRYPKAA
jgi:RNA-directed DNA polymerase